MGELSTRASGITVSGPANIKGDLARNRSRSVGEPVQVW